MSEQIVWNQGDVQTRWDGTGSKVVSQTSWGLVYERLYDSATGQLRQASWRQGDSSSSVDSDGGRITHIRQADGGEWKFVYKGSHLKETINPEGMKLVYDYDDRGRVSAVDCGGMYRLDYSFDSNGRLNSIAERRN